MVVFVNGTDGYEMRIEGLDDLWLRERTRPHYESSASATTEVDASIVRKEKDWTPVFLRQLKCVPDVFCPANFIEVLFLRPRLQCCDSFRDPSGQVGVVGDEFLGLSGGFKW